MRNVGFTDLRANFTRVLDGVANDREAVVVVRNGHEPVVIVPLAEYEALLETTYLMRSPANARRLMDAMGRLESASRSRAARSVG
ncbi:type II toxin-antitoxin system Phd/YefM family antitoxin [uncultured Brevibacterium sp.]|uniref:type II toxin-antitoxin system Phd/YefM family antitoxin n=1 Tax=uncultured Brevibacterium sp. TaxID=189678 RepID=UPI0025D4AC90|nr:type II toxin-antitoxin system prevent-host-death family antitoxin [uncultured Brevibacterium sp.]